MAGVLRLCYLACGWLVCHGCASLHASGWRVETGVYLTGWCVMLACVWLIDVLRYSACDCLVCHASSYVIGWRAVLVSLAAMVPHGFSHFSHSFHSFCSSHFSHSRFGSSGSYSRAICEYGLMPAGVGELGGCCWDAGRQLTPFSHARGRRCARAMLGQH